MRDGLLYKWTNGAEMVVEQSVHGEGGEAVREWPGEEECSGWSWSVMVGRHGLSLMHTAVSSAVFLLKGLCSMNGICSPGVVRSSVLHAAYARLLDARTRGRHSKIYPVIYSWTAAADTFPIKKKERKDKKKKDKKKKENKNPEPEQEQQEAEEEEAEKPETGRRETS